MEARFFKDTAAFHRWLATNHAKTAELLVGFYRKESGDGLQYSEALDEALCFGWIDGVRRKLDEDSYCIRFTPRKPDSNWSTVNVKRATALQKAGRMSHAGLAAFAARSEEHANTRTREIAQALLNPQLAEAFAKHPRANEFFSTQPPGYRRLAAYWATSAKREETRARRMARLIELSGQGKRLDMMRPNGE